MTLGVFFGTEPSLDIEQPYSQRYTLNMSLKNDALIDDTVLEKMPINKDIVDFNEQI
jgi:hypothetical protein